MNKVGLFLSGLLGVALAAGVCLLWASQTPEVVHVRHDEAPNPGIAGPSSIVPGRIQLGDEFSFVFTVKNGGWLPIYNATARVNSSNSLELVDGWPKHDLRTESVRLEDGSVSRYRQTWIVPLGLLRPGEARTIALHLFSMGAGPQELEIGAKGLLPPWGKAFNRYHIVIDPREPSTTVPLRRDDVHMVLQHLAYVACQKAFPCRNAHSDGTCMTYPDSDESQACVVGEIKQAYAGCEISAYDKPTLDSQLDCLIRKHRFALPSTR